MYNSAEMSNNADPAHTNAPRPFKPGDIVRVLRAGGNWQLCSIISIDLASQSAEFQPVDARYNATRGNPFNSVLEKTRHKQSEYKCSMITSNRCPMKLHCLWL